MDCCDQIYSITSLKESEDFLIRYCDIASVEEYLKILFQKWKQKWDNFDDISGDVLEKVEIAHKDLLEKCVDKSYSDFLQTAIECVILNQLHDCVIPLIYFFQRDLDQTFYEKCKKISDMHITAEQLGAPPDYAIPLAAAIVEFASLDTRKSPVEKIHCLCTTYDLIFAELKSAMIEIISKSTDMENQIPVIENYDIVPILMSVIIKAKLIHLYSSMYYIENFLWKLQESQHVRTTISIFKRAIERICDLTEDDLQPSNDKLCRELDFQTVAMLMCKVENEEQTEQKSLVENHVLRICNLILTSTTTTDV